MKKHYPLFWKLYPPFLLLVLVPILLVSEYADVVMRRFFLEQTAVNLKVRANLLKDQVIHFIQIGDDDGIDKLCKQAGKSSETRFTVIALTGKVLGDSEVSPHDMENHSGRPEVLRALDSGAPSMVTRDSATLHQTMMYLAIPMNADGKPVGVLRTSLNITTVYNQLYHMRRSVFLGVLITALLATAVALLFSRRVSYPLEKIREGAEHFAGGELSYRLPVFASSETESLARTMNDMAASLDERMQTIIGQRNEIEAVLSSMAEGVVALNLDEVIISVNQMAALIFHSQPSELLNRSVQEAIRNPDFHRFVRLALQDENPHEADMSFFIRDEMILNIRCTPLRSARGDRIGILIVLNDVTRLRQLENMRRSFASNVSHEIRTPLTAIKGFAETLKSGALNHPQEAARFVDIIENHANRLIAIVEDIMNLSAIEQKGEKKQIALAACRLEPLLVSAMQTCRQKADEKKIECQYSCDPEIHVNINARLMEQAFVNLLDNAIKYSESGNRVDICADASSTETTIAFHDEGMGIPAEHLPRLFERFYRVDESRSRKLGGTGLGLAIVKHIVAAHGGHVTVESTPGKGSVFIIHLPVKV